MKKKTPEEIASILEAYANDIHELVDNNDTGMSVVFLYGDDKSFLASSLVSGTMGSIAGMLRALCAQDKDIASLVLHIAVDLINEQANS